MPHARGEKSSAWNGQAATNQTPNPSQYVLVSFHLISRAIKPLQPTPSGSLFSKIQDKTTPKGRVHFHHDTRPLKTRLVTLPPLRTKPHLGTTPSLVIDNYFLLIWTPAPLGSIWQEGIVPIAQSNSCQKCLQIRYSEENHCFITQYCFSVETFMFNCVPFHFVRPIDDVKLS